MTLLDLRAMALSPEIVSIRANALRGDMAACRAWCGVETKADSPEIPPAPPIVWYYCPPELRVVTTDAVAWWRQERTVKVGGLAFRRGSGRNVAGHATRNGRMNWHASYDAHTAHVSARRAIESAHQAEVNRIWHEHAALVVEQLADIRERWRDGRDEFWAIPSTGIERSVPGYVRIFDDFRGFLSTTDMHKFCHRVTL